jgi:hypothetical protein
LGARGNLIDGERVGLFESFDEDGNWINTTEFRDEELVETDQQGQDGADGPINDRFEEHMTAVELGTYVVYAEECANNFMMERSDSEALVELFEVAIRRGISEGTISRQEVNQGVSATESVIAMNEWSDDQRIMCQGFTYMIRQIQPPADRF